MATLQRKNFDTPDETRSFPHGKLEVMRHLSSGIDWAMAGLAIVAAAAATPAPLMRSRLFSFVIPMASFRSADESGTVS